MNYEHTYVPGLKDQAVVMFHGYGADMHDLSPLHQILDPDHNWHWYFLNGPVRISFGGFGEGRAWFPIDMAELEMAMRMGRPRVFADKRPAVFVERLQEVGPIIKEIAQKHKKIVLGGFSQGAMLATHLAMQSTDEIRALVVLSGALLDKKGLEEATPVKDFPFFQSHGDADSILSFNEAKELYAELENKGLSGLWAPFRGGHEIPPQVIRTLSQFLYSL